MNWGYNEGGREARCISSEFSQETEMIGDLVIDHRNWIMRLWKPKNPMVFHWQAGEPENLVV